MNKIPVIFALFTAISACAPTPPEVVTTPTTGNLPGAGGAVDAPQGSLGGVELCDAANYRPLVGTSYKDTIFPTGPKIRVYSDTSVVTQEYLPDRTNIVYDDQTGNILRAFCG